MTVLRCPTCHQQFEPTASRAVPFCSPRCRLIDLNRWLTEEISIPVSDESEDDTPRQAPEDGND